MPPIRRLLLVLAVVISALVLLGAGFGIGVGSGIGDSSTLTAGVSHAQQDAVLKHLEQSYYQQIDPAALETDAINGMVAGLNDPYTVYLNPTAYANLTGELSGSFIGIGVGVDVENGFITIATVLKGGPAAEAGIQAGDIIVSVDGTSTAGMTIDQVIAEIQGKTGTSVTLGIYRPPAAFTATTTTTTSVSTQVTTQAPTAKGPADLPPGGSDKQFSLVRREVTEPQLDSKLITANGKKVADITLYIFSTGAGEAVRAAVKQAVETDKVAAVILDLRGNGGGLLNEGIAVASVFVPQGVIVTTRGLHSPSHSYDATGGAFADVPLCLLVDRHTASASEIVAGALQDYKRATLVGETTFGKGLVQEIEPLADGAAVKVTTAEYFAPKDRNINKKGIAPDVPVATSTTPGEDAPLQQALKLIGG